VDENKSKNRSPELQHCNFIERESCIAQLYGIFVTTAVGVFDD